MIGENYLITGGMGCLGAWIVRNLVHAGKKAFIFDFSDDRHRLELVMTSDDLEQVAFIKGDITDRGAITAAIMDHGITHLIHLAALQVPACKNNPPLGAAVNVIGTVNVFESAKKAKIPRVVYASSIAVYGGKDEYKSELLPHDALSNPHTHYGVFKQANEGTAHVYWQDDRIASIGLRPYTLYGPGRDQGLTSSPTQAMLAAARGEEYHISYGGTTGFQYNDDVAKIFIQASHAASTGAQVFNLKGSIAHMNDVITAIESAEPNIQGKITFEDTELNFPKGTVDQKLRELLGDIPNTPLEVGVAQTIAHFKQAIAKGLLSAQSK